MQNVELSQLTIAPVDKASDTDLEALVDVRRRALPDDSWTSAEIAAAKSGGFRRLVTESEERNEPMRRLNEQLGFVPSPELSMVVVRGPLS